MSRVTLTSTAASTTLTASTARRDLAAFFVLVVLLSAPVELAIVRTGALAETSGALLVALLMWMPALASIVVRLVTRQGFGDVSFRLRGGRAAVLRSPLLPLAVGVPAYALALALGLVQAEGKPWSLWAGVVIAALIVNLVVVPGEEIGWRGFMVTRLVDSGAPAPLVMSGIVWGSWHLPLVLWGGLVLDGPEPWVSAVLVMVLTTGLGYVLARLRMDSGSVWPPIAVHVGWNVLFQAVFELSVSGSHEGVWVGEAGVLTCVTITVAAFIVARRPSVPVVG